MILFFPQYQAGYVPSNIPKGAAAIENFWAAQHDFHPVEIIKTDIQNPQSSGGIRFRDILKTQALRAQSILNEHAPDFVLTTGGDCGASYASIAYLNERYAGKIGVIWVDAHADIHVPSTSPSGNYHGMVVRNLLGADGFDLKPARPLETHQVAYLGLRDTELEEDDYIAQNKIPAFRTQDILNSDVPLYAVLDHFKKQGLTHIHLHVDCDVMDVADFPHVHVPEHGGLSVQRLIEILTILRTSMPMAGCCVTEYAPQHEGEGFDIVKRIYEEGLGIHPDA